VPDLITDPYDGPVTLTGNQKLAITALLFALAVATVAAAAATSSYVPLFFTILPLVAVAWVLSRGEPGEAPAVAHADGPERSVESGIEDEGSGTPV
jgi:hypothetical protein